MFLGGEEVTAFEGGRYKDDIRELYMELVTLNVGTKNVEGIIRSVLFKIAGLDVGRLPKASFAKYMFLEARCLAMEHLKEEIKASNGILTVGSDGTTKFGHHYGNVEVSFTDGKSMVAGLRDMATGDAGAYLDLLKDIVKDLAGTDNTAVASIVEKMKNTISDQASVNKRLNVLLKSWREELLPLVIEGYHQMGPDQKAQHAAMNNFWCGLHFLVGLSEQSNKTLAVWEELLHGGRVLGSPSLPGGYSKAGESGTTRLVRTVCKALQDRGCEKSGKPVLFQDFIRQEGSATKIPLAPFKGNRFNILFHNAAGLYYLLNDLLVFLSRHQKDNKLFTAINQDIQVPSFQAGCRALGLVSKLVSGPLWRELEKDGHVLDMVPKYQHMFEKFQVRFIYKCINEI